MRVCVSDLPAQLYRMTRSSAENDFTIFFSLSLSRVASFNDTLNHKVLMPGKPRERWGERDSEKKGLGFIDFPLINS